MTEEEGRRLGGIDVPMGRFAGQFKQAHATIEGASPRLEVALARLDAAEQGIAATIDKVRTGWRAPTNEVARDLSSLARAMRRLRRALAGETARLLLRRTWLQLRVFWHRHWRKVLVAAALLLVWWLAATFGPPAWAWIVRRAGEIGDQLFGAPL